MSVEEGERSPAIALRGLKVIGVDVLDAQLVDRRGRRKRA